MQTSNGLGQALRPQIDGLRAVAIGLVVAYHYFGLPGRYIGVDVFFVISGYLITGIVLTDLDRKRFSFSDFYPRRFRRILPPLMLMICTVLVFGWIFLLPLELRELAQEACASALYLANFLFWLQFGYFDSAATTKPLLHLWSLGVEEQFYLVWPAILLFANRIKRSDLTILALLLASFAAGLIMSNSDPAGAFYSPFSRLWELAAGGVVVELERSLCRYRHDKPHSSIIEAQWFRTILPACGLLLILGGAILFNATSVFPGYLALIPTLGAALILGKGFEGGLIGRILAWGPLVHVGKRSYSLYLWHWPVLVLPGLRVPELHLHYLKAACLAVSCLLAWISFSSYERPIRAIGIVGGNAWRFLAIGTGTSAVIAVIGFLILSGTLARPSDAHLIAIKPRNPQTECTFAGSLHQTPNTSVFAPCEAILYPGRPVVLLFGDRTWS